MSEIPHIALRITQSALLPDFGTPKEDLASALLTKRTLSAVKNLPSQYRLRPSVTRNQLILNSSAASSHTVSTSTFSPQSILKVLNLLDVCDADVVMQTARVKEGIKEVQEAIITYKEEREQRVDLARQRREQEKRETKEIGSDFWAGV